VAALNCGTGVDMAMAARIVARYRATCGLPVMAQPNAGQPVLEDMKVVYKQTPEEMGAGLPGLLAAGPRIVGGRAALAFLENALGSPAKGERAAGIRGSAATLGLGTLDGHDSLLAQIGSNGSNGFKYLYIGRDVVEVELDEPVEQYYSELVSGFAGNPYLKVGADVPLAYAITKHYVYFFHTMKRFDRDAFPTLRDVVPPLNPATDYSPAVKTAMRKTAKRIIKNIRVPFTSY
jgi:hypothetical protein